MENIPQSPKIGTLNEKPLHAALKEWCAEPGDRFEVALDGYVIDIVRGEELIEIQTRNFSAIRPKLLKLLAGHPVRLIYPIPQEKWLIKIASDGRSQTRRKSPKRGGMEEIFRELVRIPEIVRQEKFSLEVLLIQEEEVRRYGGRRGWRRKDWVTEERRLLKVISRRRFETPADFWALVPESLPQPFTTSDLATAMKKPRRVAQQAAYCFRKMDLIGQVGKQGRSNLYAHVDFGQV